MNLSEYQLTQCAAAIASGTARSIDLSGTNIGWEPHNSTLITQLAKRVEQLTSGVYTVKYADSSLFGIGVRGPYLYAGRCPIGHLGSKITELSDDILLIGIGPYGYGLTIRTPPR